MKIAILSFSFLTSAHIARLKKLGEVVEYQTTNNEKDALERLEGVEVAIADCWDVPFKKTLFEKIKGLKYVSLNSTGFNQVDLVAAREGGVAIANVPGFSTESVAELAIGLLLAVVRHIPRADREMHQKPFQIDPANRSQDVYLGRSLRGKTLGIIGLGAIGARVAELARGFGMQTVAYNRSPKDVSGVAMVDLDTLLKTSDIISLNAAFADNLKNIINQESISKMKSGVFLINTARGEFVDEQALVSALKDGRVGGFGADVLADWSPANPLLGLNNVVLTPHQGFFSDESLKNMADIVVANVESYVAGKPANIVNP